MRKIIIFALLFISVKQSGAQSLYNQAIGIKAPVGISLTYKKFLTTNNNLEAMLTVAHKNIRATGLYEFNFYSFKNIPSLSWFVGPGIHFGAWEREATDTKSSSKTEADIGIDGIIGFDYKFNGPVDVSIDWQPSVTIAGSAASPSYGGIAIRYVF
jgi:hypothetical protein